MTNRVVLGVIVRHSGTCEVRRCDPRETRVLEHGRGGADRGVVAQSRGAVLVITRY